MSKPRKIESKIRKPLPKPAPLPAPASAADEDDDDGDDGDDSKKSPLMTIPEGAGKTRMSVPWMRANLDLFEVVRLGRRVFVTEVSVDRRIKASTTPPAGQASVANLIGGGPRLDADKPPSAKPAPPVKRGRGRPRKNATTSESPTP
jgi:hypothetical protein